jgi:hypothetical protein
VRLCHTAMTLFASAVTLFGSRVTPPVTLRRYA